MTPLVSIIVPIYDVEEYLDECVQSVLCQSYSNFELILVDDGSTDGCGMLCDAYASLDTRIAVIHKENGGLSDARNTGLDRCHGDYVTFLDGDDYLDEDYLAQLLSCLLKYDADISICQELRFTGKDAQLSQNPLVTEVYNRQGAMETMLLQVKFDTSAWGKLYKRRLFMGIHYPIGKHYEDLATTYLVIHRAERVVTTSAKLYMYRQRATSITGRMFSERDLDILSIADDLLCIFRRT